MSMDRSLCPQLWKSILFHLLVGCAFAGVLTLPSFLEYRYSQGNSLWSLTGVDEGYYLSQMLDAGKPDWPMSFYEKESAESVQLQRTNLPPTIIINLLGKSLLAPLGRDVLKVNLCLDVFLVCVAYLCFFLFYYGLRNDWRSACTASIVTIALPWLYWPEYWFELSRQRFFDLLVWAPIGPHTTIPALRSLYTQASLPVFFLVLFFLNRALLTTGDSRRLLIAGMLHGLLFYLYFFAWLSAGVLIALILSGAMWIERRRLSTFCLDAASLGGASFVISAPGLYMLSRSSYGAALYHELFGSYWYFSPTAVVIGIAGAFLSYCFRSRRWIALSWLIVAALSFGQLLLMNLQPILSSFIAPFRGPQIYYHPLFGGVIVNVLLGQLFQCTDRLIGRATSLLSLSLVLLALLPSFRASQEVSRDYSGSDPDYFKTDFSNFIAYVKEETQGTDVIAMPTARTLFQKKPASVFDLTPLPNGLYALANRRILFQEWALTPTLSPVERMTRELLLGWLISGTPQPLWPCDGLLDDLSDDLFTLTWSATKILRHEQCEATTALRSEFSLCDALAEYQISYLALKSSHFRMLQDPSSRNLQLDWTAPHGSFSLFSFDQDGYRKRHCPTS